MKEENRFIKQRLIHQGESCHVYRAWCNVTNSSVILKKLVLSVQSTSKIVRLKHEYELLKKLNNDHVIKTYGLLENLDEKLIILQDIGGFSLRELMEKYSKNIGRVLSVARDIGNALAYLHNQNMLHKDLKPENIVINMQEGKTQLIDFGLAGELLGWEQTQPKLKKIVGTLKYISPEQTGRLNRPVDQRSDLYSLGVILYELLTATLPFQAESATELIHQQLAKTPEQPAKINPKIPKILSDLVMKLLCKNPDERYQTANGLLNDLKSCLDFFQQESWPTRFILGQNDRRTKIVMSNKLYGRSEALMQIKKCLEDYGGKKPVINFVTGPSGSGKSTLIGEFELSIQQSNGFFARGKYDQYQRNVPYFALLACLNSLIDEILALDAVEIESWKQKILSTLGENTRLISEMLPRLKAIVGEQEDGYISSLSETQNRFQENFSKFIGIFAQLNRPFVLFLDDVQWADSATINLIKSMLLSQQYKNLYLICAYRDNLVDDAHPISLLSKDIIRQQGEVHSINLQELSLDEVKNMLEDMLQLTGALPEDLIDLAQLIVEKTYGNPFFVNSFIRNLYDDKLLRMDHENGIWKWDMFQIRNKTFTSNVVEMMMNNIIKLPSLQIEIIKRCAILGNNFCLDELAMLMDRRPVDIAVDLMPVLKRGFLILPPEQTDFIQMAEISPQKISLRFLHDRVQQAAYSLIDREEGERIHLKMAKHIFKADETQQDVFSGAYHFIQAKGLLTSEEELLQAAKITQRAAIKAVESASFESARSYYIHALEFIDRVKNIDLLIDFKLEMKMGLAESESLCSNFEQSQILLNELLKVASRPEDICRIQTCLLIQHTTQGNYAKAIESGSFALKEIGIYFPKKPKLWHALPLLLKVKARLVFTSPEEIFNREHATEKKALLGMSILSNMSTAAYIFGPEAMLFLCLRAVDLSLRYGNAPVSSFAYALLAFIESAKLGGIKNGDIYSHLAIKLNEHFKDPVYRCKVYLARGSFIQHTFEPIRNALPLLEDAFQSGVKSGDFNFANYSLWSLMIKKYFIGGPLLEIYEQACDYSAFTEKVQDKYTLPVIRVLRRHIYRLSGVKHHKYHAEETHFDVQTFVQEQKNVGYSMGLGWFHVYEGASEFIVGDLDLALQHFREAKKYCDRFLLGQVTALDFEFYSGLCHARAFAEGKISGVRAKWNLFCSMNVMKRFARHAPGNYQARYLLLLAEYQTLFSFDDQSLMLYERAFDVAKEQSDLLCMSNSLECVGRKLYTAKRMRLARYFLMDACSYYNEWGARNKIKILINEFPQLMLFEKNSVKTLTMSSSNYLSEETAIFDFDAATILNINKILSDEKDLAKIFLKFTESFAQNAASENAFMFMLPENELMDDSISLKCEDQCQLLVSWTISQGVKLQKTDQCDLNHKNIKNILKKYFANHHDNLSENNVMSDRFTCIVPISIQGRPIGLMLLENSNNPIDVSAERFSFLKALADQAGIIMINALFRHSLEAKVSLRTNELNEKNQQLEIAIEENKSLVKILCHDLNNTLTVFNLALAMGKKIDEKNFSIQKSEKLWNMVKQSVDIQNSIIGQVRTMVSLKSEKQKIELCNLDLVEVMGKLLAQFQHSLELKSLTVSMNIDQHQIVAEETSLINSVLANIFSNAIKFSQRGGVIFICCEIKEEYLILNIRDSGIGMPEDIMLNIFKSDKPTSRPGTEGERGTGFGLPLVKTFMHHYGGRVQVESKDIDRYPEHHGTTFKLIFKLALQKTQNNIDKEAQVA